MAEYKPLTEEEIKAMQRAAKTAELLAAPANFLGRAVNNLWELPGVVTTGKTWNQRNYQPPPVTEIPTSVAGDGIFSATLEDSKEATREARLNQAKENVLPGTGSRYNKDGSKRVLGVLEQPNEEKKGDTSLTQKVAEIPKAPTGPDFTPSEKRALNQVRGSVAQNKAKLKQWQFDQKQHSVTGLQDQPTNASQPTPATKDPVEPDYNPGDAIPGDERGDWKPGVMHEWNTDMDIDAKAQPVSGGMSAGNAMAINAGVKLLQAGLADKDKDKALQNKEALATAKLGSSTDRQSQLGWLEEPEWMSWVG